MVLGYQIGLGDRGSGHRLSRTLVYSGRGKKQSAGGAVAARLPPTVRGYGADGVSGFRRESCLGRNVAKTYAFSYDVVMKSITASKARANLYRLIEETSDSSEPVQITGKRVNAVLVSEQDWQAIQETMYLLSIPGMRESIREGMNTPVEECSEEIDW